MDDFGVTRRRFMTMSTGMGLGAWIFSPGSLAGESDVTGLKRFERRGRAMGTEVSLTILHDDEDAAREALKAAMYEIERIESLLSIYREETQISRLNREGKLESPDPTVVEILKISREHSERSGGAFDITVQPLWELYARAVWKEKRLPSAAEVAEARSRVGYRGLEISSSLVCFNRAGMAITLNGIGQGYATDRALDMLRKRGIRHALVNAGELGAYGAKENQQPWVAGIQHPRIARETLARLPLRDRCLATSGDYATTFTADRKIHHIFDPHTGLSPQELSSVSVLCKHAVDADALCKPVFILGLEQGRKFIEQTPDCEAYFVLKDGNTFKTAGFPEI